MWILKNIKLWLRIGCAALLVLVTYKVTSYSYIKANNKQLLADKAAIAELQQSVDKQTLKIATLSKLANKKQRVITKEIIKYVKTPDRTVCKFDAEWLRIFNNSIKNANNTSAPQSNGSALQTRGNKR